MSGDTNDLDAIVARARDDHRSGANDAAAAGYDAVLERDPDHVQALHLKGILQAQVGSFQEGLALVERAAALDPADVRVQANLAKLRLDSGDVEGALAGYEAARALAPDDPDIIFNLAGALMSAGRIEEAIRHLEHACAAAPDHAAVHANLGNLYRLADRPSDARRVLEQAVDLAPDDAEVQHSLGVTLADQRDYDGAMERFRRALALDRSFVRAATQLFYTTLYACDWRDRAGLIANFERLIERGGSAVASLSPLVALFLPVGQQTLNAVSDSRSDSLLGRHGHASRPAVQTRGNGSKLRIGYLSPDFGRHPVGHLVADLFPRHDREKFEVTAFALARPDGSEVQQAIHAGVDRLEDLTRLPVAAAAERIVEARTDILIDLGGYTRGAQPGILAARAVPLQIGWLGYCGSSGGLNDVLLTDTTVVPPEMAKSFRETVAHLPGTFMPLNRFDAPANDAGSRIDHGLPENGFVFCAFNAPTKIDDGTFGAWMTILDRVSDSVLWLRQHAPSTTRNLVSAAAARNIDPARLVFAPGVKSMGDHLARHRHADLFLDTFVYGAHSTAADALAMRVPVITKVGASMPARVGASLCYAHRLSELVTENEDAYVDLAVALANDRTRLDSIASRLGVAVDNDDSSEAFVAKLEACYGLLWKMRESEAFGPGKLIRIEARAA